MSARPDHLSAPRTAALEALSISAARNIPGADFVSITVRERSQTLHTLTSTHPIAARADALQYELGEGPCLAAVAEERFVLVNDLTAGGPFPRYRARAVDLGLGAQAAIQLIHNGETAALNLYARTPGVFDRATVQLADLFATHAGSLLGYAVQVEQLSEALHTRTDIGIAVGIVMERFGIARDPAFAFLVRHSNTRNVKLRELARQVADGTFRDVGADRPEGR